MSGLREIDLGPLAGWDLRRAVRLRRRPGRCDRRVLWTLAAMMALMGAAGLWVAWWRWPSWAHLYGERIAFLLSYVCGILILVAIVLAAICVLGANGLSFVSHRVYLGRIAGKALPDAASGAPTDGHPDQVTVAYVIGGELFTLRGRLPALLSSRRDLARLTHGLPRAHRGGPTGASRSHPARPRQAPAHPRRPARRLAAAGAHGIGPLRPGARPPAFPRLR